MSKSFTVTKKQEQAANDRVAVFMSSGDWSQAGANDLVALYKMCHKEVYGLDAADVTGNTYAIASTFAKRMLTNDFAGDGNAMVSFIHWVWSREKTKEERRKESGGSTYRLGWRLQFGNALLVDYKLYQHRSAINDKSRAD